MTNRYDVYNIIARHRQSGLFIIIGHFCFDFHGFLLDDIVEVQAGYEGGPWAERVLQWAQGRRQRGLGPPLDGPHLSLDDAPGRGDYRLLLMTKQE